MDTDKDEKEKKHEEDNNEVWAVTITHHSDGYKPRDMGVSTKGPYLFHSERQANRWLRRWLLQWCREQINEEDEDSDDDESNLKRYNKIVKSKKYEDVKALAKKMAEGEYVPNTLSWEVVQVEYTDDDEGDWPDVELIETKKQQKKRKREDRKKRKMLEEDESKVWCTSCLHTVFDHDVGNPERDYRTYCKGCGGDQCSYFSSTLTKPTAEQVAARQTPEAKARRVRQCEGEEPYTEDESEDDLDEKPHRHKNKKARVEPEGKEEKKTEPEPVVQVAMEAGSTVVHAQGQARITTGSGLVHTAQSEAGTPIMQVAKGPGSTLVCALGNSRIVMRTQLNEHLC